MGSRIGQNCRRGRDNKNRTEATTMAKIYNSSAAEPKTTNRLLWRYDYDDQAIVLQKVRGAAALM